jgi:hypothetical protein
MSSVAKSRVDPLMRGSEMASTRMLEGWMVGCWKELGKRNRYEG